MNHKRVYRLWRVAGLVLPRRRPSKRIRTGRHRSPVATSPNVTWAYDFVHDVCANGDKLKCLVVVDECTRKCLAILVARRIHAGDVVRLLARLVRVHGAPQFLRSDNGPEFIAEVVQEWLRGTGIETAYIEPGKPWQNGVAESFIGRLRDECLNAEWFANRREAAVVIERWRRHYNESRPHSSLGYRTPAEAGAHRALPSAATHPIERGVSKPGDLS